MTPNVKSHFLVSSWLGEKIFTLVSTQSRLSEISLSPHYHKKEIESPINQQLGFIIYRLPDFLPRLQERSLYVRKSRNEADSGLTGKSLTVVFITQSGIFTLRISGVPRGIRTPVLTVKGWCPRPLDDGDQRTLKCLKAVCRQFVILP